MSKQNKFEEKSPQFLLSKKVATFLSLKLLEPFLFGADQEIC